MRMRCKSHIYRTEEIREFSRVQIARTSCSPNVSYSPFVSFELVEYFAGRSPLARVRQPPVNDASTMLKGSWQRGLAALIVLACSGLATGQGEWKDGRASYYGMDGWSIHHGNCGFGYQWPDIGTGWDAAALADASPEFAGSCGRCYEVRCDPKYLHDGYGTPIDRRSGICYDPNWSVVVRTVDSCPCWYPSNAYSNKRWCCGDNGYTHFDLSVWAFEKLADKKWGVIGLKYRQVPCAYKPSSPAPTAAYPTPGEAPPAGAKAPNDYVYVKRTDSTGQPQGAVKAVDPSQASGGQQVSYDSLFEGGGAFTINPLSTSNAFAASNMLGRPFGAASASVSSSSSSNWASASASAIAGGSAIASSIPGYTGSPLVMAFGDSRSQSCTDVPVPGFTCQQQKDWGKCGQAFLVAGGYCMQTCGRCSPSQGSNSASGCEDVPAPGGFSCQQQKDWGKCGTDVITTGNYCAATCGRCSTQPASSLPPQPLAAAIAGSGSSGAIYYQGFQEGWSSWSFSSSFAEQYKAGINGDKATCGAIYQYGGFQAGNAATGKASGKSALQFWVDSPSQLTVNVGSPSATCIAKPLQSLGPSEQQAGFSKFYVPLSAFACPFGADQITHVTLANAGQSTLNLCISDVRFL